MSQTSNVKKPAALAGAAPCSAFARDYREAHRLWGLRTSWHRDTDGESKADRVWNALLWSATLAKTWTPHDQLMLEGAAVEFEILSRLSLRMPNAEMEQQSQADHPDETVQWAINELSDEGHAYLFGPRRKVLDAYKAWKAANAALSGVAVKKGKL